MRRVVLIGLCLAGCAGPAEQHEITVAGELLTEDGRLREPGWSRRQLLRWDPERVHDPARLRQWDFYAVASDEAAVNVTLVDLGFLQAATVGAVDLATGEVLESVVIVGGADAFVLSSAVEGEASLVRSGATTPALAFTTGFQGAEIAIDLPAPAFGEPASGTLTIARRPEMPYLSLATPFREDPHLFFYEQKLHGMTAEGTVTIGARTFTFDAAATTAVMDWGRGAWPATAMWRWAGASGVVDGVPVWFNLGDGFGDPSHGTENLVVVGDVAHKLGAVEWTYDPEDPTGEWRFESDDGRVSLVLAPVAPEVGGLDFGSVYSRLVKAYGTFSGTVTLDDGTVLPLDGLRGFAEEMQLAW